MSTQGATMDTIYRTSEPVTQPSPTAITTPAQRLASSLLDRIEIERQNRGGQLRTFQRLQKRAAEIVVPAYGREVRR